LNDGTSEDFHFVVLAVGNFNQKFLPEVSGADSFMGHILHSSDLLEPELVRSHHVVVVGYGKSALDSLQCGLCVFFLFFCFFPDTVDRC